MHFRIVTCAPYRVSSAIFFISLTPLSPASSLKYRQRPIGFVPVFKSRTTNPGGDGGGSLIRSLVRLSICCAFCALVFKSSSGIMKWIKKAAGINLAFYYKSAGDSARISTTFILVDRILLNWSEAIFLGMPPLLAQVRKHQYLPIYVPLSIQASSITTRYAASTWPPRRSILVTRWGSRITLQAIECRSKAFWPQIRIWRHLMCSTLGPGTTPAFRSPDLAFRH